MGGYIVDWSFIRSDYNFLRLEPFLNNYVVFTIWTFEFLSFKITNMYMLSYNNIYLGLHSTLLVNFHLHRHMGDFVIQVSSNQGQGQVEGKQKFIILEKIHEKKIEVKKQ